MCKAIFVHMGIYDAVVSNNGVFMVDKQVLHKFLNAPLFNYDFSQVGCLDLDNIWDFAQNMGKIVAYYKDDTLHVHDENLWKKRMLFWSKSI